MSLATKMDAHQLCCGVALDTTCPQNPHGRLGRNNLAFLDLLHATAIE